MGAGDLRDRQRRIWPAGHHRAALSDLPFARRLHFSQSTASLLTRTTMEYRPVKALDALKAHAARFITKAALRFYYGSMDAACRHVDPFTRSKTNFLINSSMTSFKISGFVITSDTGLVFVIDQGKTVVFAAGDFDKMMTPTQKKP